MIEKTIEKEMLEEMSEDELEIEMDELEIGFTDIEDEDEKRVVCCECCGREIDLDCDDFVEIDGKYYCDNMCAEDDGWAWCERCEEWHDADSVEMVHSRCDERWCEDCRNDGAFYCENCCEWFDCDYYSSYDIRDTGEVVCSDCACNDYYWCERCENYVSRDGYNGDEDMCEECAQEYGCDYRIKGYHDHKGCERYFDVGGEVAEPDGEYGGLELEIDRDCRDRNSESGLLDDLVDILGEHAYYEHDGSLNNGFEIITHPHTIEALYGLKWERVFAACRNWGYTSHDGGTCGLHVHVSKTMLGRNTEEREIALRKILVFYDLYFEDIVKLSRRKFSQYESYAKPYGLYERCDSIKGADKCAKNIVKNAYNYGRYRAINLLNRYTIEFRLGRGTLNAKSFFAWLDFTFTVVRNARRIRWVDIYDLEKWCEGMKKETFEYMIERNAFANNKGGAK